MSDNHPTLVIPMPESPKRQRERIAAAITEEVRLLENQGISKAFLGLKLMNWLIDARAENENLRAKGNNAAKR